MNLRAAVKAFLKEETPKKYLAVCAALFAAASLFEVFLFNFRHFESRNWQPYDLLAHETPELQNLIPSEISPGTFTVAAGEGSSGTRPGGTSAGEGSDSGASLHFTALGREIKNIRIRLSAEQWTRHPEISVSFTDAGNTLLYPAGTRSFSNSVPRTNYIRVHSSGVSEELKIEFSPYPYSVVEIESLQINAPVPFSFSAVRVLAVTALLFLAYFLRPSSAVYRFRTLIGGKKLLKFAVFAAVLLLQIALFRALTTANSFWGLSPRPYDTQYHRVAEALAGGRLALKDEPPEWLKEMENPYDTSLRTRLEEETGEIALWDHAFYEGKYYSYFGILPALIYYLPYYLVTGAHAPNYFGVFLALSAFAAAVMPLLYSIVKRWFRDTPLAVFLLLYLLFVNTSGAVYIARRPDFYGFPIILSAALSAAGLRFWIAAKKEDGSLSRLSLLLGSLLLSLNALSRPQFLLTMLLAVPLFWDDLFRERVIFSRKTLPETFAAVLPVVLAAAAVMALNAARFSSPLDFGANYNLTSNDMTVRGFVPARIPSGLFSYLFQPPSAGGVFPYLQPQKTSVNYVGVAIYEPLFGGFFAINPLAALPLAAIFFYKQLSLPRPAGRLLSVSALLAFAAVIADTEMAGILQRYQPDFAFLFLLAAAVVSLAVFARLRGSGALRCWTVAFNLLIFAALLYQFFLIFTDSGHSLGETDPVTFEQVRALFEFLN